MQFGVGRSGMIHDYFARSDIGRAQPILLWWVLNRAAAVHQVIGLTWVEKRLAKTPGALNKIVLTSSANCIRI